MKSAVRDPNQSRHSWLVSPQVAITTSGGCEEKPVSPMSFHSQLKINWNNYNSIFSHLIKANIFAKDTIVQLPPLDQFCQKFFEASEAWAHWVIVDVYIALPISQYWKYSMERTGMNITES